MQRVSACDARVASFICVYSYIPPRPGVRTSASRRARGSRAAAATRARAHACAAAYSSAESFPPPVPRRRSIIYRDGRAGRGAILRSKDMCASRAARGLAEGAVRAPPARARDGAKSARRAALEMLHFGCARGGPWPAYSEDPDSVPGNIVVVLNPVRTLVQSATRQMRVQARARPSRARRVAPSDPKRRVADAVSRRPH